jgi:hypothetical protein
MTDWISLVELGVVIGKGGRNISEENADAHVAGYGTAHNSPVLRLTDMTMS